MSQPRTTAHCASRLIAERIEALYGHPIAVLEAHAEGNAMLAALTGAHAELVLAERGIVFELDRLLELADPDREIDRVDAGHILDCARRIAAAVAARDAYAHSVGAVLGGLRRVSGPDEPDLARPTPAPPVPAALAPASAASRAR
ncbi:hypothetical protein AB0L75_28190 [Streptomyces sp. NPDC052101]|uniref:hypothetical protein n=1 Tax=Streptomyces sp. NPDC052101 TaxID=3155763 RepID=UPI00341F8E86